VAHLRHKESDRLELLAGNLTALGRATRVVDDGLRIEGDLAGLSGATVVTGSDHRIAMAFAVAGLRLEGVCVDDADCVTKSDPGFWDRFEALRSGC
jgi:3-phosphoshikimate 1-carboxyvinyltransferase